MTWSTSGWSLTLDSGPNRPHNMTLVYEPWWSIFPRFFNKQIPNQLEPYINLQICLCYSLQETQDSSWQKNRRRQYLTVQQWSPWRGQNDKHVKTWKQGGTITSAHPPSFSAWGDPVFLPIPLSPCPLKARFPHDEKGDTMHSISATQCCQRRGSLHHTLTNIP